MNFRHEGNTALVNMPDEVKGGVKGEVSCLGGAFMHANDRCGCGMHVNVNVNNLQLVAISMQDWRSLSPEVKLTKGGGHRGAMGW